MIMTSLLREDDGNLIKRYCMVTLLQRLSIAVEGAFVAKSQLCFSLYRVELSVVDKLRNTNCVGT